MQETVDAFFADHDFGAADDDHGLLFQHFDSSDSSILFLVHGEDDVAAVQEAVTAAMAALTAAHPECAAVTWVVEPE